MSEFLWGVATGAHQTEGNNIAANWWVIEHAAGSFVKEPSGDAVDSYHRWREDMDLAQAAGFTDYRFGIEWSRIEPEDGQISRAEIDHYRRLVDGANARGLRPFVTLHHFTLPRWFADAGGWLRPDATERFLRYVEAIAPVLSSGVEHVGTINEPNIVAIFATLTAHGPEALNHGLPEPDRQTAEAMVAVHRAARLVLKSISPDLKVGWGVSVQDFQAEPGAESALRDYAYPRDEFFAEASRDDDWIGVQTYTRVRIGVKDGRPVELLDSSAPTTLSGWEYYPAALGGAVRRIATVVGAVPIIVTENGIATNDDEQRVEYTRGALQSLRAAIDDGIDVRGYLHWSMLDNYEWGDFTPTFGLVSVDRSTFERTAKPSLGWLGALRPLSAGQLLG
jgi:beta-glucosidase